MMKSKLARLISYFQQNGVVRTLFAIKRKADDVIFSNYERWLQAQQPSAEELARQSRTKFAKPLLFSVLTPTYNTEPKYLRELADCLLAQSYGQWEACFYDGASPREDTRQALLEISRRDERFKVCFGDANTGISGNTNSALAMASGEYIALCDHDDLYAPDALFCFRKRIEETGAEMLYSDEDKLWESSGRHFEPNFKPDFSPVMLRERNYICHLLMLKRTLMEELGGLRPAFDGSQDHDLALRASEKANKVEHIARILYHWRMLDSSMSHRGLEKCVDAGKRAVCEQMERLGIRGGVKIRFPFLHAWYELEQAPAVTLVWVDRSPEGAYASHLEKLLARATGCAVSPIAVVDERGAAQYACKTVLRWKEEMLPTALNRAVEAAQARYVAILDATISPEGEDWLRELLMYARRPETGMVTSAVYDARGRLRHAGYAIGMRDGVASRLEGLHRCSTAACHLEVAAQNVSAVAWAYCAFRKELWATFGGWDERYGSQLFDVDLCLQMGLKGLYHVYVPTAAARLEERRGLPSPLIRGRANEQDQAIFQAKELPKDDPFYNSQCSRRRADFSVDI